MLNRTVYGGVIVAVGTLAVCAGGAEQNMAQRPAFAAHERTAAFEAARQLAQAGKEDEAFLAYAAIPGAQHIALRIARPKAAHYLELLKKVGTKVPAPLAQLLEADLHLALGDRAEALRGYRAVVKLIGTAPQQGWASGHVPRDAYLVEPPTGRRDSPYGDLGMAYRDRLLDPFTLGPGSHRDNWLLRRIIALEAWDAAAREFARVWEIHRSNAEPHLIDFRVGVRDNAEVYEKRLIRPAGFDGHGLQFALDYAFFLRTIGKNDMALSVLQEPLVAIDMDHDPNHVEPLPVKPEDALQYPLRKPERYTLQWHPYGMPAGISRKEFIRLAYGVWTSSGNERELVELLEKRIAAGESRLRRALAQVRFHQGRIDDALAPEASLHRPAEFRPVDHRLSDGSCLRRRKQAARCGGRL